MSKARSRSQPTLEVLRSLAGDVRRVERERVPPPPSGPPSGPPIEKVTEEKRTLAGKAGRHEERAA